MKLMKKRAVKKTTGSNCDQKARGFSADSSIDAALRGTCSIGDANISSRQKDRILNPYNALVPKPTTNERSVDCGKKSNAKRFAKNVDVRPLTRRQFLSTLLAGLASAYPRHRRLTGYALHEGFSLKSRSFPVKPVTVDHRPVGIATDLFGVGDATFIPTHKELLWFLPAY